MSDCNFIRTIALGSVVILLLVEFSMFHDIFYPFWFLWDQGNIVVFFPISDVVHLESVKCIPNVLLWPKSFTKSNFTDFSVLLSF